MRTLFLDIAASTGAFLLVAVIHAALREPASIAGQIPIADLLSMAQIVVLALGFRGIIAVLAEHLKKRAGPLKETQ